MTSVYLASGGGEHTPVPHHVTDGGTALAVGAGVGQFVGVAEGFAVAAGADSAGDIHLVFG